METKSNTYNIKNLKERMNGTGKGYDDKSKYKKMNIYLTNI
jgi:hypothetical protein